MDFLTGYAAFDWCARWANPTLDVFFRIITDIGSHSVYYVVCVPLFWVVDRRRAGTLFMLVLVSALLNTAVKLGFNTPRPDPSLARVLDLRPFQAASPSFPSGHTQGALVFWSFVALWVARPLFSVLCAVMIGLIALSRVYLGAHFPIDILGGLGLGAAVLFTMSLPIRRWAERDFEGFTPWVVGAMVLALTAALFTRDPSLAMLAGCLIGFFFGAVWLPQATVTLRSPRQRTAMVVVGLLAMIPIAVLLEGANDAPLRLASVVAALWIFALWLYPQLVARFLGSSLASEAAAK